MFLCQDCFTAFERPKKWAEGYGCPVCGGFYQPGEPCVDCGILCCGKVLCDHCFEAHLTKEETRAFARRNGEDFACFCPEGESLEAWMEYAREHREAFCIAVTGQEGTTWHGVRGRG